jgi:hypothetical protein
MAVYDFKCGGCGQVHENIILPMTHEDWEHPACYDCGEITEHYYTTVPMVMWRDGDLPDGGFVAGKEKKRISTKKERREFMAENDLVDSNDLFTPPTNEEQMDTHADVMKSVSAITPDADQKKQMKDDGILDIV